jgi:hypothetical protein
MVYAPPRFQWNNGTELQLTKAVLILQVDEGVKGSFNLKMLMVRKKNWVGDIDGVTIVSNKMALQEFGD